MRREMWAKNVVAIGLSAGFLEPLESTSIHLIQSGIAKFISLLPDRDCDPNLARQFNALFAHDMENIRDFLVLHYHSTSGKEDPLWAYCRNMALPDSLIYKEAHFKRSGRVMITPQDLFQEASWLAVLMGQGITAADYNPLADLIAPALIDQHLRQVRDVINRAATSFPTHEQALAATMHGKPTVNATRAPVAHSDVSAGV
jgi:tryptophan halogenase